MAPQNILVVGATGQQGGAVINALLDLPEASSRFHILALTRNAQSDRAKALASAHQGVVELVEGDNTNPQPIFASQPKGSIASLFVVTTLGKINEEEQAIPLIDAAVEHGVKHIVFTSVDRGGDKSWTNPTDIRHFRSKHNIELHLRNKADKEPGQFTWTILRPVGFFDNMNPGMLGSVFTAMWAAALSPNTKLQLVGVRDIGIFAAKALSEPAKWSGRAFALAGDELTLAEAREKFERVVGKPLPQAWTIVGRAAMWGMKELGDMFAWFENEGYGADIAACKREVPSMQDLEAWLRESSKWMKE
ncbi:NAD(P)-binding protein [Parathielavia appendiculata]|uniref:NAD(P)-binding protein n=1 Tax=Parathielavia appendiculata TaxID=2587402 RepID=A0AAN6TUD3_9PEZI|nr:NAD(P)-binding protein [Parathielavia appendiculata]